MTSLLEINDGKYRMPNFVIWSASYVSAKTLECKGASHHPLIWATIIHTFFSLFHPVDELSFKEMRMLGQPNNTSSCLCVWCKSKELGGRGSTRFPKSMVESFSADFVPAIESYWTEPYLKFCQTSTTELLCEIM